MFFSWSCFREMVDGLIAALADGFIHLHLQDEVAAAFQIQPQLDAVGEVCLQLLGGRGKLRQADNPENTKQNDDAR